MADVYQLHLFATVLLLVFSASVSTAESASCPARRSKIPTLMLGTVRSANEKDFEPVRQFLTPINVANLTIASQAEDAKGPELRGGLGQDLLNVTSDFKLRFTCSFVNGTKTADLNFVCGLLDFRVGPPGSSIPYLKGGLFLRFFGSATGKKGKDNTTEVTASAGWQLIIDLHGIGVDVRTALLHQNFVKTGRLKQNLCLQNEFGPVGFKACLTLTDIKYANGRLDFCPVLAFHIKVFLPVDFTIAPPFCPYIDLKDWAKQIPEKMEPVEDFLKGIGF